MLSSTLQCPSFHNGHNVEMDKKVGTEDSLSVGSVDSDQKMSLSSSSCTDSAVDSQSLSSICLSDDEMGKVAELRERLGTELLKATPLYDDDQSLIRWIDGWDSRWNEIVPRFRKASQILEAMGVNEMEYEHVDELNEHIRSLYPATEYFVGGLMGYDKEGNIIVMQSIGQIFPKLLVQCGRVSDVFRLSIVEAALTIKLIKKQERIHSRRLGIVVILDLDGLCMDHVYAQSLKVYMNLLKLLQDMFPDVAKKIFVINAPSLFASAYNLVKPAVAEKTRQRVQVFGSNYSEQLCAELGHENVYPHWGGCKEAKRGNEQTGTLRMGGRPPDSLRYLSANNQFHIDDSLLIKLNVPARTRRTFQIQCGQAGQMLRWFFHTTSDIDFSVEFGDHDGEETKNGKPRKDGKAVKERKLVVPKFRLHTDFVPEYNSVRCHTAGTYHLCFDNSFSTFFSKDIRFHVHCVDENYNDVEERTHSK